MVDVSIFSDSHIGYWLNGKVPELISGICNDTRALSENECFLAIKTSSRDGNDFLSDAKDKGASCAIVSKSDEKVDLPQYVCDDTLRAIDELAKYSRSRYTGKVIAITGSYGKTSTREILKLLLGIKNNVPSGNKNGQLGIPMMLCSLSNDEQFAIIEIGVDQIGSIDGLIDMVRPNIGIVTGITKCHMFGFGDEESAANEKCKLIAACSANGGVSIFNEECLRFESFKIYEKNSIVIENSSDNPGPKIKLVGDRYESTIQFMGDTFKFVMPPLMSFGVAQNFMLAATCVMYCGVSAIDIQNRISSWAPYKMRGEVVAVGDRNYFIDCYNANPVSFVDSLLNFNRLFNTNNRLFILGALTRYEVGDDFVDENCKILRLNIFKPDDQVILIGESADKIVQASGMERVIPVHAANEALRFIENFKGDVYIKGHRSYKLEQLIV